MKKLCFQANYKKYVLYYTEAQKRKIDYMNDWKRTINCLKYQLKSDKNYHNRYCSTCYVANAIDNYCFHIENITSNQYIIKDKLAKIDG